ncbi:MAG: hypothetical protein ACK59A_07990 [Cyanobacteriota bacterium]|jgi:hypothetical protein
MKNPLRINWKNPGAKDFYAVILLGSLPALALLLVLFGGLLLIAFALNPLLAWIFLKVWNLSVSETLNSPMLTYYEAGQITLANSFISIIGLPFVSFFRPYGWIPRIVVIMFWWNNVVTLLFDVQSVGLGKAVSLYILALVLCLPFIRISTDSAS